MRSRSHQIAIASSYNERENDDRRLCVAVRGSLTLHSLDCPDLTLLSHLL